VLALDVGQITNGSATKRLTANFLGAVAQYHRETTAERTAEARARAVARGVPPWPGAPPGYRRAEDGRLEPDPNEAPVVAEAFRMRADGTPITAIREYLHEHGIDRTFGAVQRYLGSRVVLGELRHGKQENTSAHPAIVDVDTWRRVQRTRVSRGRKPKSDRLLARLGVLRCASCGARMTVGNNHGHKVYRCPQTSRCSARSAIQAPMVEGLVIDKVREALAGVEGRASAEGKVREAARQLERAQADLDAAFRAFEGFEGETAARERLRELHEARDEAQESLERLGGQRAAVVINAARDWGRLTLAERRDLIRATVESVSVAPGRGPERVTIKLLSD
jgi:site-specific DNA recombinase